MKTWIASMALVVGVSSLSSAGPKIVIPETRWDFGHVPQNSTLTHDYLVWNLGSDTLKILRINPG